MLLAKVIITILTTVATLILLFLNYRANKIARRAVREMQIAREEEYRPYVFADIEFSGFEMDMVLKNQGKSEAFNICLSLDQNLKVWNALVLDRQHYMKDLAITNTIEMLAPGDEFREWLDQSGYFFRNNEDARITGKLTYQDGRGKKYEFAVDIDLTPFATKSEIIEKKMPELIRAIENLRRDLERNW